MTETRQRVDSFERKRFERKRPSRKDRTSADLLQERRGGEEQAGRGPVHWGESRTAKPGRATQEQMRSRQGRLVPVHAGGELRGSGEVTTEYAPRRSDDGRKHGRAVGWMAGAGVTGPGLGRGGCAARADEPAKELTDEERTKLEKEATELNQQAVQSYQDGKYETALALVKKSLEILKRLYPADKYPDRQADLANSLSKPGLLLRARRQPVGEETDLPSEYIYCLPPTSVLWPPLPA